MHTLRHIDSFGKNAAEDEPVLSYFLKTDAVSQILRGDTLLVLGRKGSGKTALVRHLSEGAAQVYARSLSLRGYPWALHATRVDRGASSIEAYVSSWRYLIAAELASLAASRASVDDSATVKSIKAFFRENYGGPDPTLDQVLRPATLRFAKGSIEPTVLGNKIGSVALERGASDANLGLELDALSDALLSAVRDIGEAEGMGTISLHFDELDQGLSVLDEQRATMLIGLILASRDVRRRLAGPNPIACPVVYLRTDIWEDLEFSDKNKIAQNQALHLEWTSESLRSVVDLRIQAKLKGATWDDIAESRLMRGSQTKWNHMLSRTFLRPRDIIQFANIALKQAKARNDEPLLFSNEDIVAARDGYSKYLKEELDDEVIPHWPHWSEALKVCSAMQTITFNRETFVAEYERRRSSNNAVTGGEALKMLYRFSVIGYERRSGYGGISWVFHYAQPEAGWDTGASSLKVHLGLKEYAKLAEERR